MDRGGSPLNARLRRAARAAVWCRGANLTSVSCTASRLLIAAFAAYLLGSLLHDAVVTWAIVAVAVAAALGWTRWRGSGGRSLGHCGPRCATRRGADAHAEASQLEEVE